MSCSHPLVAIRTGIPNPQSIKILRNPDKAVNLEERYGRENVLFLPCGHCPSCELKYRMNWSIRCEMESLMYDQNCFITLTYDDKHLIPKPKREEVRKFLRALWNRGFKGTYFACGERGSKTGRSHYHVCLFGFMPDDLKFYGISKSGESIFTSKYLDDLWKKGSVKVGLFEKGCAQYVAGYTSKKLDQDNFLMMSKGLGFDYMNKNVEKLFHYQNYVGLNGKVNPLPRYFERICELNGYDFIRVREERKEQYFKEIDSSLIAHNLHHHSQLFGVDAANMKDKLHRLKRGL